MEADQQVYSPYREKNEETEMRGRLHETGVWGSRIERMAREGTLSSDTEDKNGYAVFSFKKNISLEGPTISEPSEEASVVGALW